LTSHDSAARIASLEAQLARLQAQLRDLDSGQPADRPTQRELLLLRAERTAQLGSWTWHAESGHVEWSDEMFRIFGFEPGAFQPTSEHFFEAVEPLDRARVQEEARRSLESGDFPPSEFSILRPSGEARRVRLQAAFWADEAGPRSYVVGTLIDLTDTQRSEEVVGRVADELKRAQRVARMGSFTWTFEPPRLEWSPGIYRLLGLKGDETPSEEAFHRHVHPEDLERLLSKRAQAVERGVTDPVEFRLVSADGTILNVELESQELRDSAGALLGFRGVVQDVTRRMALEQEQRQAQKMEAIGRLAGGVAHDFNNYLMILMGQAELILSQLGPRHALAPAAEAILNVGERCSALTSQLLTLSRRRSGTRGSVNLGALLRRMAPVLRTALGETSHVELMVEDPDALVLADEGQLEQVVMNLALNARDAMPRGGTLSLSVERILTETHGPNVRLTVRDTGEGIAPEHRARIFEPFFTTKRGGHGTGLGLSTVYGIVQDAGGRIEVESELGKGTTFHLDWVPSRAAPRTPSPVPPPPTVTTPLSVLVVEDIDELREMLKCQLERAGHRVLAAEHGAAALAILEEHAGGVDVVLTDAVMPVMGGVELERRLAALHPCIPCVLMTAYAEDLFQERTKGREMLRKPFSIRDLLAMLQRVARRAEWALEL
jgi:two-component system cell cycle sensor histidine kinase/response regulator CckA